MSSQAGAGPPSLSASGYPSLRDHRISRPDPARLPRGGAPGGSPHALPPRTDSGHGHGRALRALRNAARSLAVLPPCSRRGGSHDVPRVRHHARRGLVPAAHLGIAMQLTNICRDVQEDWGRGHVPCPTTSSGRAPRTPCGPGSASPSFPATSSPNCGARCSACSPTPRSSTARAKPGVAGSPGAARSRCGPPATCTRRSATSSTPAATTPGRGGRWCRRAASSSWWHGRSGTGCADTGAPRLLGAPRGADHGAALSPDLASC